MAVGEDCLKHALKSVDSLQPTLHEMEVLQENPVALFGCVEERILCWLLLTLAHGNVGEFLVSDGDVVLGCDSLDFRSGVDTREEHEEDWDSVVGFSEGFEDAERRLFDVPLAHDLSDKGGQS